MYGAFIGVLSDAFAIECQRRRRRREKHGQTSKNHISNIKTYTHSCNINFTFALHLLRGIYFSKSMSLCCVTSDYRKQYWKRLYLPFQFYCCCCCCHLDLSRLLQFLFWKRITVHVDETKYKLLRVTRTILWISLI